MLKVEKFVVNPLQENSFILFDETGECIFVDPGFHFDLEHDEIRSFIGDHHLTPVMIANTHAHFDHIMGVEFIRAEFNIPFKIHRDDLFLIDNATEQAGMFGFEMGPVQSPDSFINENEPVKFGNSVLRIIHIPGHSPGHVVFYSERDKFLLAGDVLFCGSIGRTDLPGGNYHSLISGIKSKLFRLPEETKVFCGHGPETKIGIEKFSNPFLT